MRLRLSVSRFAGARHRSTAPEQCSESIGLERELDDALAGTGAGVSIVGGQHEQPRKGDRTQFSAAAHAAGRGGAASGASQLEVRRGGDHRLPSDAVAVEHLSERGQGWGVEDEPSTARGGRPRDERVGLGAPEVADVRVRRRRRRGSQPGRRGWSAQERMSYSAGVAKRVDPARTQSFARWRGRRGGA
eukprot:scaffold4605_cov105-Isochrysis_galbana.AAC.3